MLEKSGTQPGFLERGGSDFLFHFNATFLFIANVFEFILVRISLLVNIYLQKENRKKKTHDKQDIIKWMHLRNLFYVLIWQIHQ